MIPQVLQADPKTAHHVGKPNVFLSHAWLYRFPDVVEAINAFAASRPEGDQLFFWFDCFSIDEHATQALPQDWWSTAFKVGAVARCCRAAQQP